MYNTFKDHNQCIAMESIGAFGSYERVKSWCKEIHIPCQFLFRGFKKITIKLLKADAEVFQKQAKLLSN